MDTSFCSLFKSVQRLILADSKQRNNWPLAFRRESDTYYGKAVRVDLAQARRWAASSSMLKVKDTLRATVNLTFDGRVIKNYHGTDADKRFDNEIRILRHLEAKGCQFVPRLLEADSAQLRIVTTNCGTRVEHLDAERAKELFAELENYGVRHDDPEIRNVTYRQSDGRFCIIDFELATLLSDTR